MHFIKIMIIRSWAVQWCCITKENLFLAHLLPSESTPHYNYLHHNPHHMWDQRRGSNLAKQYNFKKQKLPGFLSTKMAGGVRLARHQTHLLYCELLYWFRVHSFVVSWAIVSENPTNFYCHVFFWGHNKVIFMLLVFKWWWCCWGHHSQVSKKPIITAVVRVLPKMACSSSTHDDTDFRFFQINLGSFSLFSLSQQIDVLICHLYRKV